MSDNFFDILNKPQTGSALLLAMLVLSAVLVASSATSNLVLTEARQSFLLDRAVVAFYGAESGVERALYQARRKEYGAADLNNLSGSLPNNAEYLLIAENSEDALYPAISENESFQLDLYDPGSFNELANPIKAVKLEWAGEAGSWLEVNWTAWSTSGNLDNPQSRYLSVGSHIIQLYDATAYLYRMRLIARKADVNNLQITAYSNIDPDANCLPPDPPCQVPIPGRLAIKGIGEYPSNSSQASQQALLITMPVKSPLSGLYDYVLYSEEEIKKEN